MGSIYVLSDPRTGELRYVGKTSRKPGERLRDHVKLAKRYRHHTASWIKLLLADGVQPEMEILEEVDGQDALNEAERFWISQLRALGFRLTNSTEGGDGQRPGYRASAETREKMSRAARCTWSDEEYRQKMSKIGVATWQRPEVAEVRRTGIVAAKALLKKPPKPQRPPGRPGRAIKDQNGVVYKNQLDAARRLGVHQGNIAAVLSGRYKQTAGYSFTYVGATDVAR